MWKSVLSIKGFSISTTFENRSIFTAQICDFKHKNKQNNKKRILL